MRDAEVDTGVEIDAIDKAELHCHLDGVLDAELARALRDAGEPWAPGAAAEAEFAPAGSLADWLHRYVPAVERYLAPAEQRLPVLAEHHVRRLHRQRVVYAELMVSGLLFVRDSAEATVELYAELRARIDRALAPGQRVVLVGCIGRGPPSRTERQTERLLALARAGLVRGVALAGDESACRVADIAGCLARLRDAGLGIEIHAGELLGPESVADALDHGRPDRLGHAVTAFADPRLVDRIAERGVHLELCPTSNLRLGAVPRIEDHPLRLARERGLSFSVNTDDPGVFGCSMTSELALVQRTFGLGRDDLARICRDALAARFE